jgi:hypothetical protein
MTDNVTRDNSVSYFLSLEEGPRIDFKEKYEMVSKKPKKDLAIDVCAMANYIVLNGGKGHIIVGVEKKTKKIVGVDKELYTEEKIQQIISSLIDPPPIVNVEYLLEQDKIIVVLTINRNISTLYQVVRMGFPIRRGSITDYMSTGELIQAIKNKIKLSSVSKNEYDSLAKDVKGKKILSDIGQAIYDLGFGNIITVNYQGEKSIDYIHYPCDFLMADKRINNADFNFVFCAQEYGDIKYLRKLSFTLMGLFKDREPSNCIFISFYPSNVSSTYFKNMVDQWHNLIQSHVDSSIKYLGFGEKCNFKHSGYKSIYIPKFYVYKIKSIDDIKEKIETIMQWIESHNQLFMDTFASLKKSK